MWAGQAQQPLPIDIIDFQPFVHPGWRPGRPGRRPGLRPPRRMRLRGNGETTSSSDSDMDEPMPVPERVAVNEPMEGLAMPVPEL